MDKVIHTNNQPWDMIYDFKYYRITTVRKIITRWKKVNGR